MTSSLGAQNYSWGPQWVAKRFPRVQNGARARLWGGFGRLWAVLQGSGRRLMFLEVCKRMWKGLAASTHGRPSARSEAEIARSGTKSAPLEFQRSRQAANERYGWTCNVVQTRLFRFGTNLRCEQQFGIR